MRAESAANGKTPTNFVYDGYVIMPTLTLALLGTFHVQHGSTTLTEFHSNSVRALLVYLAVEPDRPHERKLLGDLLWPDEPPAKGLLNLRQALYRLDQALAPVPFTQITRQTVQRTPALPLTLDTHRLSSLISAAQTHRHRRLTVCGPCLAALHEVVGLYQGDFLVGFSASAPFDEWLLAWRERLRTQVIWALDVLATHHTERGEWAAAETYLRRWLELEPWREEAHRHLMLALASAGQRSAALAQYEQCRRVLARDLDATPETATSALAARLRVSDLGTWFAPPYAVPAVETPLMGRTAVLAAIAAQLAAPVGRLLTLTGPGGSGKTRLAIAAAAAERGTFTDGIFFVSLVPVSTEDGLLAALVDHALLQRVGPDRYALHPLVRQFAAEHHAQLPAAEQSASRARHQAYFLGLVVQHAAAIVGPAGRAAVELLCAELADIYLAWHNASLTDDLALMGAATHGLLDLLRIGELQATGSFTFAPALPHLRARTAANPADRPARQLMGQVLVAHAETSYLRGDYATVISTAQEAVALARTLDQAELEGEAHFAWGKGLRRQGMIQAAQAQFAQATQLIRTCPDSPTQRRLRSDLHRYLGMGAWSLGHFAAAYAHYQASLRLAQSIAYRYGESNIHYGLSLVANMQGSYAEALEHATAALAIFRASGNRDGEGLGLISLGLAHMYRGEDAAAQAAFVANERLYAYLGDRDTEIINRVFGGLVQVRLGDYPAAEATLAEGLTAGRVLDYPWGISIGLYCLGLLRHVLGDQVGAVAACREALAITAQAGDMVIGSHALTHLGHALAALGETAEAARCYERAITIRRAIGQPHLLAEPLMGLIELALARGDLSTARAHTETILASYTLADLTSADEPSRIMLACYRSLILVEDTRAGSFLRQAALRLRERAARLASPEAQATFCEAVAANRILLALAEGRELFVPTPQAVVPS